MSSTTSDYFSAAAGQARDAMAKSVDFWQQSAGKLSSQTSFLPQLPQFSQVDVGQAVERYFEVAQQVLDAGREMAVKWVAAVGSLSGLAIDEVHSIGRVVREQAEDGAQKARSHYQELTTAELSGIVVDRDLPTSGGHDELVERLVQADSE